MRIGLFETMPGIGGGNAYLQAVSQALQGVYETHPERAVWPGVPRRPGMLVWVPLRMRLASRDCWILTTGPLVAGALLPDTPPAIGLFYHFDSKVHGKHGIGRRFVRRMWRGLARCKRVVVIADYWRRYLEQEHGLSRVTVIRMGLDAKPIERAAEGAPKLRAALGFTSRPLVYLGNARKHKGVLEAWTALRGLDADFVTSGPWSLDLPVRNFNASREEYWTLLAACDVVLTMSTFAEGWNITAQEAMLAGTPVVGTGYGGMGELLRGGGQLVCEDFAQLRGYVERAVGDKRDFGERGRQYARTLTRERFRDEWLEVVDGVCGTKSR